jgi:predicted nicotinamide N-methyase
MADLHEITRRLSLDLHEIRERIESASGKVAELKLTTLRDLNATIDLMFEELERLGMPELLEKLCPYFGVVWPSARALAGEVLEARPCRMLEMGCGLAVPSLVAARRGFDVVATDFHPQVERFLELNREVQFPLRYIEWDWHQQAPSLPDFDAGFDWVTGSDLLYDRSLPVPLARTMARAVAPGGRITLTDPARPYLQLFCDELTKNLGFNSVTRVVSVPHPRPENPGFQQEIFVIEFSRP